MEGILCWVQGMMVFVGGGVPLGRCLCVVMEGLGVGVRC